MEIATLVARGYTNRQVADDLGLSVRTVETHRANVLAKLGISTRAELLRWAVANKLTG
jgi:two-component system response regulator NreC